jgi:hypothetical protein
MQVNCSTNHHPVNILPKVKNNIGLRGSLNRREHLGHAGISMLLAHF